MREDALRDVRKQWCRNHVAFETSRDALPVYPTIASQFNDPGLSWMFVNLCTGLGAHEGADPERWRPGLELSTHRPLGNPLIPGSRVRYLAEIAEHGARPTTRSNAWPRWPVRAALLRGAQGLGDPLLPQELDPYARAGARVGRCAFAAAHAATTRRCRPRAEAIELLRGWAERLAVDHRQALQLRGSRPQDHRRQLPQLAEPAAHPEDRAPALRRLGRSAALPDEGEPARLLPVHGRRVPLPARERGPDADVRRRGDARADQPPLPLRSPRASRRRGCRPHSTR